jgi:hypothetical protein
LSTIELHGGDVMLIIMPDQVPVVGKRPHKGPGVKNPGDRAIFEALAAGWLALFDTAEAAQNRPDWQHSLRHLCASGKGRHVVC